MREFDIQADIILFVYLYYNYYSQVTLWVLLVPYNTGLSAAWLGWWHHFNPQTFLVRKFKNRTFQKADKSFYRINSYLSTGVGMQKFLCCCAGRLLGVFGLLKLLSNKENQNSVIKLAAWRPPIILTGFLFRYKLFFFCFESRTDLVHFFFTWKTSCTDIVWYPKSEISLEMITLNNKVTGPVKII